MSASRGTFFTDSWAYSDLRKIWSRAGAAAVCFWNRPSKCEDFSVGFLDHPGITNSGQKSSVCGFPFSVVIRPHPPSPSVKVQWIFLEVAWEVVVSIGR